ncbi:MAG: hypothetical protein ACMXYB_01115 [Candidatus Woesearchaeota archaeon]
MILVSIFNILCLSVNSHAISFYEDKNGTKIVFTTNLNPMISLNLESMSNSILVVEEILVNGIKREYPNLPRNIEPFNSVELNFLIDFDDVMINSSNTSVVININSQDESSQSLDTLGDPTQFKINYVPSQIELSKYKVQTKDSTQIENIENSNILIREGDLNFVLEFPVYLTEFDVRLDSQIIKNEKFNSKKLSDLPRSIEIDTSSLAKGSYDFQVTYKDVSGNSRILNLNLIVLDKPLEITKVFSNVDDSSYGYYFDTRFSNSEIFTNSRNFEIVFETNQEASCYKEELDSFNEFVTASPITNQVISHRIPIEISGSNQNGVWIMCENIDSQTEEADRVYLSESIFGLRGLFSIKLLQEETPISILSAEPSGLVTSEPIIIDIRTSSMGICEYEIESLEIFSILDMSENFTRHRKTDVLSSQQGEFEILINCFDRLYNRASKTLNLNIDSTQQIRIIDFKPKLAFREFHDFEIQISDTSATCRLLFPSSQNNLEFTQSRVEGRTLHFNNVGPFLEEGRVDMVLRCTNRESRVSTNEFQITVDKTVPTINSVNLFNSVSGPTTFFSNSSYMKMEIDSNIQDLAYFMVEFSNSQILINSSGSSIEVFNDFSQDTSFKVRGVDLYGRSTPEFTQNYQFDNQVPQLIITMGSSSTNLIIKCVDENSGCHSVFYGTSSTKDTCQARTPYEENSEVDVFDKNFLCVRALDNAGNEVFLIEELDTTPPDDFIPSPTQEQIIEPLENETPPPNIDSQTPSSSSIDEEDPFIPEEPFVPQDSEFNFILLSAFAFIVLLVGAGGYYSYSKGYLDNQLIAMGAKKKSTSSRNDNHKKVGTYSEIPKKDLNKTPISSSITNLGNSTVTNTKNESKYDSHLSKLNEFIDSTLKKDSNVFDEFKNETNKEKTKNFNDNIDNSRKNSNIFDSFKNDISKKETETFKDTLLKSKNSMKDEKESFEDFYESNKKKKEIRLKNKKFSKE